MSDTHPRATIRQEIVSRLKASREVDGETLWATPAGNRVFPARELPTSVQLMPALLVYDDKEEVQGEYYQDCPRRVVTMTVEAQATAENEEQLDLILNAMALQIERVVMIDPTQGKNAQDTNYDATQKQRSAEGDRLYGWLWVDFKIDYAMPLESTAGELHDFLLFHPDYDLSPKDGSIEATDDICVRGTEGP